MDYYKSITNVFENNANGVVADAIDFLNNPDLATEDPNGPAYTVLNKPFVSTNRSGTTEKITDQMFNDQLDSDVLRALEGTPRTIRGSRNKPSVMKYPTEIGSGEVPHVMQFKVFWRWENKDIEERLQQMKMETEKTLKGLHTLAGMINPEDNSLTPESIAQRGLPGEQNAALQELLQDQQLLKTVDPSVGDSLGRMLELNPNKARQVMEQTISSYQNKLTSIESNIGDETGRIDLDSQERLMVQNRLGQTIAGTDTGQAALTSGLAFGSVGALGGMILGGPKGAAVGGLGLGALGAAAGAGVVAFSKGFQNQAIYDQMISIYLPYCTKINNEDVFVYEDTSQLVPSVLFNALGNPKETFQQAIDVIAQKAVKAMGGGDAVAAARGKVVNPHLEKLFKQKDLRNFNFAWEFYPRSKEEIDQVREIIETFRYHAHPSTDDLRGDDGQPVQFILRVPAEFEIVFLSTNPAAQAQGFVENEFIPRIGRCALNSISVDYTPNAIYSSFVDNSPTAITLSLQFSEMGIITRESVDKGF